MPEAPESRNAYHRELISYAIFRATNTAAISAFLRSSRFSKIGIPESAMQNGFTSILCTLFPLMLLPRARDAVKHCVRKEYWGG